MRICILRTSETGTVIGSEAGGQYLVKLDDDTTRAVSGAERVRVIPPGWSLEPSLVMEGRRSDD